MGRVLRPDLGATGPAGRVAGRREQGAGARARDGRRRPRVRSSATRWPARSPTGRPCGRAPIALARRRCRRRCGLAHRALRRAERARDAARLVRSAGRAQRDAGRGHRDDPRPGAEQPPGPDRRDHRRGADHRRRRRDGHRGGDGQHRGGLPGHRRVPARARDPVLAVVRRPGAATRGPAAVRRPAVRPLVLDLAAAPPGLRLGVADPVPGQPGQRPRAPLPPLLPPGRDRLHVRRGGEPGLRAHRGLRPHPCADHRRLRRVERPAGPSQGVRHLVGAGVRLGGGAARCGPELAGRPGGGGRDGLRLRHLHRGRLRADHRGAPDRDRPGQGPRRHQHRQRAAPGVRAGAGRRTPLAGRAGRGRGRVGGDACPPATSPSTCWRSWPASWARCSSRGSAGCARAEECSIAGSGYGWL